MLKFFLLAALIKCIIAETEDGHADIKLYKAEVRRDGFDYEFDTSNHIHQHSQGDKHGNMAGEFEWLTPEGKKFSLKYIADENGYLPVSEWLPTPPPIPEAILKGLEYIRAHKEDKSYHYRV